MASGLEDAFDTMMQRVKEEQDALKRGRQELAEAREKMDAEKAAIDKLALPEDDIVELNVGGLPFATTRSTLLSAPEGSLLRVMFRGPWDKGLKRDRDGRVFLDFDPKLFEKVLSYLRQKGLAPPTKRLVMPGVPPEQKMEFELMLEYLGMQEPHSRAILTLKTCCSSLAISEDRLRATKFGADGHAVVVGDTTFEAHAASEVFWTATVRCHMHWVGIGVVADASPCNSTSFSLPSSYMWASHGQVYRAGKCENESRWLFWLSGDEAVFKFDKTCSRLTMLHKRTGEKFIMECNHEHAPHYRIHLNMYRWRDCVELSDTSEDDRRCLS
eukprot:TRINITY_DN84602_c0_g1_i1.p1 TRINITY_DN84602_c0_g1~~TRINITY_DN84602_c0_g1_i1.p1  ORF type:complete len:328 (-),score=33.86 TRINITY_DN84602_c0_g1_i1:83-1066(-)